VEHWISYHWAEGLKTDFIVEEYLPNRDFCFMSIWNEGKLVTSMVRERLSWVGHRIVGSGGTSKLNRIVHSNKVNTTAIEAVKAVSKNPHGIFCVDLKGDASGVPRPTEINCRFTTNVHYLTLASLRLGHPEWNFPWLAARICLGERIPPCKTLNAFPANLWFTKNTDMGFTMVEDGKWRAEDFS
jgi:carbamoyl-phosphate synthase large subunit